jgi:hypothetical protein
MRPLHRSAVRALASAFALLALAGAVRAADEAWITLEGDEISVLCRPGDERYGERLLQIYEVRGRSIARSMSLATLAPLRVVVAPTDESFADLTDRGVPDWGVGCALPDRGLIVLRSPRIVDYPLQMETVFVHELAHIGVDRVLRGVPVPRWFDEGVAQSVAGEWRIDEAGRIAVAVERGTLPSLGELGRSFPQGSERAALAYAVSFQAVRYLMDRAGMTSPGELTAAIAAAGDFDAAVEGLTGLTRRDFDSGFREFLSSRFRWGAYLAGSGTLFVVAAVILIVALAVRTRRAHVRMRGWEDESAGARPPRGRRPPDTQWR